MYNIEEFKEGYIKYRVKYYKKFFLDKTINTAIHDAIQDNLKSFMIVYMKFLFLTDCLKIISTNEDFKSIYDKKTRLYINRTIKGLKFISKDIENILLTFEDFPHALYVKKHQKNNK